MQEENKIQTIYIENQSDSEQQINLREVLDKYLYNWKWFLLSLLVTISLAYLYLAKTHPQYQVSTTIFIDDKETGGLTSELSAFDDLGSLPGREAKKSVINEMGVLKSYSLMERVIKNLGLQTTYYKKKGISYVEIYKNEVPILVSLKTKDSIFYSLDTTFSVTPISKSKYLLTNGDDDLIGEYGFGKVVPAKMGDLVITLKNTKNIEFGENIKIWITPLNRLVGYYNNVVEIDLKEKKSSLLSLNLIDNNKGKAQDILDNLVIEYNKDAVDYKSLIAARTDSFIDDRIIDISEELSSVDFGVQEFKTKNQLTDIGVESSIVLETNSQNDQRIVDLSSQIKLVNYLLNHIRTHEDDLIPANLGLSDAATSQNTEQYNRLLLERNRIANSSGKLNPTVKNMDAQMMQLRQSVEQSVLNYKSSLEFSLADAQNQGYRLSSKKANAPKQEREFQDIKRKQQIVESLYLYLLQKREENAISLGIPVPNAKVIDKAYGSNMPVSPNRILVLMGAIFAGLIIPISLITVGSLLNNKVRTRDDVESIIKVPFLGDIPHSKKKNEIVVLAESSNNIAEAFRLLRTNMNFMLSGDQRASKTIFITSTVASEGKTFVAINLAASLSLLKKRVLLVGADIRKPKLNEYLKINSKLGLSHYLNDNSLQVEEIIAHYDAADFDVIGSGVIPPNPSELLLNGRFEGILTYGKLKYDYVIIDTAPVNQVTDTLLLGHHADLFIYVIRANYLDKRMLKIPKMMVDNKRLPNLAILINDLNIEKEGYGYGYGYGYSYGYGTKSEKPWWKRFRLG